MKHGTQIVIMLLTTSVVALGEDDNWKVPLAKKAEIFEKNVLERHWSDGLYPSSVEIPPDGGPVDQTTAGSSNVAHSVNWTANYLGGQCHRYLFTKDEVVRRHVDQVFETIYRCQLVTGVRGLQSRGYVFGHGPSYEEREGSDHANDWHQGAGEYSNLRWRGDPSHHGYSDGIYALGMYYDLVAQDKQKARCREAIDALVSYWVDNDFLIKKLDPNKTPTPILGFTDGKTPNTRIIMAAAGLKVAHHATGKQKFADAYEKLVTQYGFRTWKSFPQQMSRRSGHDDAEHVFCHLENLFRIETDPELLGFYRIVADALWANHKDDRQSLFTYIYLSLTPNAPDREGALADALRTLQSYPTNKVFRPRMNSLREDIKIVDGKAAEPLPMYESPWDNEYQWKGNLYQLDGWLARPIVSLAVPEEDAMVMYATDSRGDIYMTINGGKKWRELSQNLPAKARRLAAGPRIRMLYIAADNGFYKTARAGDTWERLPLPSDSGSPQNMLVDRQNPNVLYAVTDQGVYRSIDFGEGWIGERWESLTENCPPAKEPRFFVGVGSPAQIYALLDGRVYRRSADAPEWIQGEALGADGYVEVYPWLAVHPNEPLKIYAGFRSNFGPLSGNYLSISEDGGATFSKSLRRIYEDYRQGGIPALLRGRFGGGKVSDLVIAPHDGSIYAAVEEGVMKSTDGGFTWKKVNQGLDIPRATAIFAPLAGNRIYLSTPAGLFAMDGQDGKRWENANLRLIFLSNTQREVGSADYLDAYWRGRYFGFITDEQANADPKDWTNR